MISLVFDLFRMLEFILAGIVAGLLGALAGLGGGVVLTPVLTLFLSVPIIYATGSALISTISTSAGSASVYVRKRLANDRIGISLVTATTTGAIIGSLTANYVYTHHLTWIIYIVFGLVLLASIVPPTVQRSTCELPPPRNPDWTTRVFRLYGVCYDPALKIWYKYWGGIRWWLGWLIMLFAGFISGLLGIGSGALKVLAMDWGNEPTHEGKHNNKQLHDRGNSGDKRLTLLVLWLHKPIHCRMHGDRRTARLEDWH